MNDWLPAVFGFAFIAVIVDAVRRWNRRLLRDLDDVNDMRSVARAHANNAREGAVVRVVGRVLDEAGDDGFLVAPVSGRRCVAYEVEVRYAHGDLVTGARTSTPFFLEDEGVRAATSSACRVIALRRRVDERGRPEDVPASLAEWLEDNHSSDEWRRERVLHWWESRVEPGDTVAVVGVARRQIDPDGAAGYRDAATVLMLDHAEDAPLSIGDDPSLLT